MTLRVTDAGVRLTVPPRTPTRRIDAFLRASAPWVEEQRGRLGPGARALTAGDVLAWRDARLHLEVRTDGRRTVERRGDVLLAPADDLDRRVEAWYRREAHRITAGGAAPLAARLGVGVTGVSVRDPRTRWGSCSSTGRLSFSWRLVLAPAHVLDYVVAHEVCHLVRPDHSPAFWELVAGTFPGHAAARDWLRGSGLLLHRGPAWPAIAVAEGLSPA